MSENKNLSFWTLIGKTLSDEYVKWCFTWLMATLPILLLLGRQHLVLGKFSIALMCSTGELFVVGIVMLAEPLGMIVLSKVTNVVSLICSLSIIMMLIACSYLFCIVEMSETRIRHCQECELQRIDSLVRIETGGYSLFELEKGVEATTCKTCDSNTTSHTPTIVDSAQNRFGNSNNHYTFAPNHNKKDEKVVHKDDFLMRVQKDSFACVLAAFLIGTISVVHTHTLKEKAKITP